MTTTTTITLPNAKTNTTDALQAELALLRAELAAAKAAANGPLSLKVSVKGAVSLCGMGKWPVTLYREQWVKVNEAMPSIMAFIEANKGKLAVKGQEYKPTA